MGAIYSGHSLLLNGGSVPFFLQKGGVLRLFIKTGTGRGVFYLFNAADVVIILVFFLDVRRPNKASPHLQFHKVYIRYTPWS